MNRTTISTWNEILENQYPLGDYSDQLRILEPKSYGEFDTFGKPILPIAKKVAAQTIGLDLVAVKPLSPPKEALVNSIIFDESTSMIPVPEL